MPYHFEFKTLSELKIRMPLKSVVLFFTLRNSLQHFVQKASGNVERSVHFTDCEKKWIVTFFPPENTFLNVSSILN
jgi:hypothetical protein